MVRTSPAGCRRALLLQISRTLLVSIAIGLFGLLGQPSPALAQSGGASLSGTVHDSTGAIVSGATVTATQAATSTRRQVQSGSDGRFNITTLPPGNYVVAASQQGFRTTELRDVALNVDDRVTVRLELEVAGTGEEVTVVSDAVRLKTSPAVSTVISRDFVENLPLNGRSFQALLQLTPGVTVVSASSGDGGQFSVNGQRSAENYFTVDGVSANNGASSTTTLSANGSGQLPALTSLGGTSGLVSVDALEEFRFQTSTYAPEFGRTPGGQVSLVTRSGTNNFHGSAFEYFRDDKLDATDWFTNRSGQEEAEFNQHNFGGVLGGPILRHRLFAFGSYEGLRLLFPRSGTTAVPTQALRNTAAPVLQPWLAAIPLPNGRDLGNGFAEYTAVYSDPSKLHSTSIRVDHNTSQAFRLFGRYGESRSWSASRLESYGNSVLTNSNLRTGTAGATWVMSDRMVNDLRINTSLSNAPSIFRQDPMGGATAFPLDVAPSGRDLSRVQLVFLLNGGGAQQWGTVSEFPQYQFNLVESLTRNISQHEVKAGLDFRRTSVTAYGNGGYERYLFDPAGLRTQINTTTVIFRNPADRDVAFNNLSLYLQDNWRATTRLSMTYGVRWDLVPPPDLISGPENPVLNRTDNLYDGPVWLAPASQKLWQTRYNNFAPRFGASYIISDSAKAPLVVRGGTGLFYGLGYGQIANAFGTSYPFSATVNYPNSTFPADPSIYVPPTFGVNPPTSLTIADRNLEQPHTVQWNATVEQGLGVRRSVTIGYVGASGRDLLKVERYVVRLNEWPASNVNVNVNRNVGYSDYHSLQIQFQQRMHRGMQAMASYTLGRSRDTGSSDSSIGVPADRLPPALDYGYSNFDVRHQFSAALTYQLNDVRGPRLWQVLARNWGADLLIRARSAPPLVLGANVSFPPDTQSVRPNLVPGVPIWLEDSNTPGGRILNRQAFVVPPAQTQGDLPRGSLRGFGMSQVDLSLRREIRAIAPVRLQLRIDAFNLFNTPNFADPVVSLTSALFGQSTQMLNRGVGGQNPLYQQGGPRSLQLAIKVLF